MIRNGLIGLAALVGLSACGSQEVILPGERLDIRAPFGAARGIPENRSVPIRLAAPVNLSEWPQRGGSASNRIRQPAFGAAPSQAWAVPIGQGNDRGFRITADPVAADGRIFTLDSRANVSATSTAGAGLWRRDLTPAGEDPDDASGGGLAVVDDRLFVTTGFGDLVALNPADGAVIWRQRLDAPVTGAPTVKGGLVYIVTRDGQAFALDAANGRIRWQLGNAPTLSGIVGGAGPAATDRLVVFPFGTARLAAAFPKGGLQLWTASVAGARLGQAYAQFSDVSADPVISGNTVYAANPSGRTVAVDARTGDTIWTAREGATGPVWVDGHSLFLVSDRAELVRLNAHTGARIWGVPLPKFVPVRNERRLRDVYANFGPVLAGGRLWVASGDGQLRAFSPVDGAQVYATDLPGGAAGRPIVVNGVMYVVTADGQLRAFD